MSGEEDTKRPVGEVKNHFTALEVELIFLGVQNVTNIGGSLVLVCLKHKPGVVLAPKEKKAQNYESAHHEARTARACLHIRSSSKLLYNSSVLRTVVDSEKCAETR